jgi:outer membrane usher protein FimD/PapC
MTRAQFWKRSGDSITLAPGEEVTTGYTSMTGIQETSSDTKTVAESVSASLSAGWGPVSASLSASLNSSSVAGVEIERHDERRAQQLSISC